MLRTLGIRIKSMGTNTTTTRFKRLASWKGRYRALLVLEKNITAGPVRPDQKEEIEQQLAHIERAVNKMKVPASFADQFYGLRVNIDFVRTKLTQVTPTIGK